MPRAIQFQFGDRDLSFAMYKLDRTKLYGSKEIEAVDDDGSPCDLATLADDGRTLIERGGTGIGYLSVDGEWCDKTDLKPVDVEGHELVPVESSFSEPIKLFDTATCDDYLDHDMRLVYQLKTEDDIQDLLHELQRGTIFQFPFSYRGGLEPDAGFLLVGEDESVFLMVGTAAGLDYLTLRQTAAVVDERVGDDQDIMDFNMI